MHDFFAQVAAILVLLAAISLVVWDLIYGRADVGRLAGSWGCKKVSPPPFLFAVAIDLGILAGAFYIASVLWP